MDSYKSSINSDDNSSFNGIGNGKFINIRCRICGKKSKYIVTLSGLNYYVNFKQIQGPIKKYIFLKFQIKGPELSKKMKLKKRLLNIANA